LQINIGEIPQNFNFQVNPHVMRDFSASENPKTRLRKDAVVTRGQLPVAAISQAVCQALAAWEPFQAARQVLAYHPFRGEIDLLPLMSDYSEKHWYLPRVSADHVMDFHRYHPDAPLRDGKYGIAEPHPDGAPFEQADAQTLILVPGVLFDRQGYRLGYGKGYYDRFLSHPGMADLQRIGIVPAPLLVDALPHDPWDIPMQVLINETGILNVTTS
jgi:5-formyltetrahydrofolate cyclo-ligase